MRAGRPARRAFFFVYPLVRIMVICKSSTSRFASVRPPAPFRFRPRWFTRLATLALIGTAGVIAGCGKSNTYVPPPPPAVTVAQPVRHNAIRYAEFTGQTAPFQRVEIRARVKGFLKAVLYESGVVVDKDARLFQIDPAEYQAKVESARADVASRQADLQLAEATVKKMEQAFETRAVSEIQVLESKAQRDVARAAVDAARAALDEAKLDLGYTDIRAPIRARAAKNAVDVGNLVGASSPTLLTTLVDESRIYAYFNVNEIDLLNSMKAHPRQPDGRPSIRCELARADDEGFPFHGMVDYGNPELDKSTGTLLVRAIFPNEKGELLAGLFVRVRFPMEEIPDALCVPQEALGIDQAGRYLLVVNSQDVVERRAVEVGPRVGALSAIRKGITASDRVVVKGLLRARPGAKVSPQTAPPPSPDQAQAGTSTGGAAAQPSGAGHPSAAGANTPANPSQPASKTSPSAQARSDL